MDIPINIQVYKAYRIVRDMLDQRGYDVSSYPPLSLEQLQLKKNADDQVNACPVIPIVVSKQATASTPFDDNSCEMKELQTFRKTQLLSTGFQKRYPTLYSLFTSNTNDFSDSQLHSLYNLYKTFAKPITEVHFDQCFNPVNLWGANSKDVRFTNQMLAIIEALESTGQLKARELLNLQDDNKMSKADTLQLDNQQKEDLITELVTVFKKARTLVFLYPTRNKASITLDSKYEGHCNEIMSKHGVFIQLFNVCKLMFNVTEHEIVPKHEALDPWQNKDEIDEIKQVYNMKNIAKNNPIIPLNDPVAKFIGLRRGQLCKITRTNNTSGTFVTYRYCK